MSLPTVTIEAGQHERHDCPIEFKLSDALNAGVWSLVPGDDTYVDLQIEQDGLARCIVPHMDAGATINYRIEPGRAAATDEGITVSDAGSAIAVSLRGELVTRYVYAGVPARPYFYPLYATGQIPVTRAYPMVADAPGETRDHPHHRSLWIAHGEVNDADNWSETEGHAHTRHERFDEVKSGPVAGSFTSQSLWIRSNGTPLLSQRLRVCAWATLGDLRLLDFEIGLKATHGDVHFGDTKEGGILSIRVASEMDVPRTGRITNVYGGMNEAETWGKAAHWCDYSGVVAGRPAGIAVFDHPHSFRYPSHWHVRDYGLMTANPFGYAAFTDGVKNGSHTLPAGEALLFRYRVALHRDSCDGARVNAHYLNFVAPPRVTVSA